jgi:hypothetical protein
MEGQRLWNYRVGTPGGPTKFALRRLPIRRDFYPSDDQKFQASFESHRPFLSDALGDPAVNPYELARQFTYEPRWTGRHFSTLRNLVRAMCLDSGEELRAAWKAILDAGGPEAQPRAMEILGRLPDAPERLTWRTALDVSRRHDTLDLMKEWTVFFRRSYREAREAARAGDRIGSAR